MYENAPATKMLSTHCACCGKPLLDAASVTAGLGPTCRKRHGVPRGLDDETRDRANKLIHTCARANVRPEELGAAVVELSLLGCDKLADRVAKRAGRVVFRVTADAIEVKAPFSEAFLRARGPGKWDRERKVTVYALADALAAVEAIVAAWGDRSLVRYEVEHTGDDTRVAFYEADAVRERAASIAEAAPPKPAPKAPCLPKWRGYPVRFGAGWGVCITNATEHPKMGDRVEITTRGGKSWVAVLATDALNTTRGWCAETGRA